MRPIVLLSLAASILLTSCAVVPVTPYGGVYVERPVVVAPGPYRHGYYGDGHGYRGRW